MTEDELAQRLDQRAVCEAQHRDLMVPDNGLGWTGVRCPQCGFRFRLGWEPWVHGDVQ